VTKLDVLSGFETLKVCTSYRGSKDQDFVTDVFPYHQSVLHHATGVYTELPGWSEDISDVRSYDDLPENAKKYLAFLEEAVGVPVVLVGVGPGREQIIWADAAQDSALATQAIAATKA
jgi:adenylosuccinate synthase